jgi:hypothetical protein
MDKVNTNVKHLIHTEPVFNMAKKVIDKFTALAGENVDPRTRRYERF